MEDTNVKARPYRVEEHYRNNLTDGPSYYRVRLDSDWRQVPNGSITDAYFDVTQIFPNHRKDLLKGDWEVHLESFHGYFQNLILDAATLTKIERGDTQSIFVALPDMIQSSNDWIVTETGCRQAHVLCQIPVKPMLSDVSVAVGPFNPTPAQGAVLDESGLTEPEVAALPIAYNTTIDKSSVGCKVDLSTFDGIIHIQLQDAPRSTIAVTPGPNAPVGKTIGAQERWQASLVFVKKA
eukprot:COSAG06_NODE_4083_length_4593_cov_1.575211_2_plen_237_part_00